MKLTLLFTLLFSINSFSGNEKGNGGDVFKINNTLQVWDEVEYGNAIDPVEFPESYAIIKEQLDKLKSVLPETGRYIESYFEQHKLMWWLVEPNLRDVEDGKSSSLKLLNYKKTQVAIHNNGLVQIYRPIWDQLSAQSRAYLMMHEAAWSFATYGRINPNTLRSLVGILMNRFLDQVPKDILAKRILRYSNSNKLKKIIKVNDLGYLLIDGKYKTKAYKNCKMKTYNFKGANIPRKLSTSIYCWTKKGSYKGPGRVYTIESKEKGKSSKVIKYSISCKYDNNVLMPQYSEYRTVMKELLEQYKERGWCVK